MLKNYRKEPRDENWQNIEAKLKEDKINMQLKSKFENFAVIPPTANWENIESTLQQPAPRSMQVNYVYRIAAGICLLILTLTISADKKDRTFNDIFQGFAVADAVNYDLCQDPELIVLDIVKIKPVRKKPKKKSKKANSNKKVKTLLDMVLAIDEDIQSVVDSALIADLIKPASKLSEENMLTSTGRAVDFNSDSDKYRKLYYLPEIKYNLEMPADSIDTILYKTINP